MPIGSKIKTTTRKYFMTTPTSALLSCRTSPNDADFIASTQRIACRELKTELSRPVDRPVRYTPLRGNGQTVSRAVQNLLVSSSAELSAKLSAWTILDRPMMEPRVLNPARIVHPTRSSHAKHHPTTSR